MPAERERDLRERIQRLETINEVLMRRVERSIDLPEDAFVLFQTATMLETKVQQRTAALNAAVAELALTNQDLARARDAANAANQAKSRFIANMSHELRTPLHGILSFARFGMRDALKVEREELKQNFAQVHECGESLLQLLNELLDLAKLESGRMQFDWATVELAGLVDDVVDELQGRCRECNVTIARVPSDTEWTLLADSIRLRQVLRNLLDNALRHTRTEVRVALVVGSDSGFVQVLVEDDGPGIPEDELQMIFEKFVQSSATRSNAGGTGLGLAITREIVEAHQGRVWARNLPAGGAQFTVELPLEADQAEPGLRTGTHGTD